MIKQIFKGLNFYFIQIPIRMLLSAFGTKQIKSTAKIQSNQLKQIRNPMCPLCFKNIIVYEKSELDPSGETNRVAPKGSTYIHLTCGNHPECTFDLSFLTVDKSKNIREGMEAHVLKIGSGRKEQLMKELTPAFINQKINEHYQTAITYKWLGIICFIASLFTLLFYGFFAFFSWFLLGGGIFLLSLKSAFRSWQAQTFNIYSNKGLFMYWLKNHHWFKKPVKV
ncbi:hypothetical protein [Acinetobacter sp. Marseille-Q1618]|uniref:hypothetical protein n=1 Tax=Acinetobacter sp. Marseille-Q1618 TaxID=2697502 RepID=UPI00156ED18B|nr:hypothetical protein [Acinetobacter sp. Marseille-Q1618]